MTAAAIVLSLALVASTSSAPPVPLAGQDIRNEPRGIDFWRALAADGYVPPAGEEPLALLRELSLHLGSPDPELRDDLAYGFAVEWIHRQRLLGPDELRVLLEDGLADLRRGLHGRDAADGVGDGDELALRRSFRALQLSVVAARDVAEPFLALDEFETFLEEAALYLASERDLRGWVPGLGWVHGVAHGADVLKFLGRNAKLDAAGQHRILVAVADRLTGSGDVVFTHGEDDRLAAAVVSLLARPDFSAVAFDVFLDRLAETAPAYRAGEHAPEPWAALRNATAFLRALHVRLGVAADLRPDQLRARNRVLETLAGL